MLDCMKSAGLEVKQIRKAAPFLNINLKDNIDVIYHRDSVYRIMVTAGQNLVDGIITELEGNTLYIRNENRCNWVRNFKNKYTVDVFAPALNKVSMYGSGEFRTVDTLIADEFTCESWNASGTAQLLLSTTRCWLINHIGRADIHASGSTYVCFVNINETGVLDASNLVSKHCYIRSSTLGRCMVYSYYEIGAEIKSAGDIYYYGQPVVVSSTISGTGKLVAL